MPEDNVKAQVVDQLDETSLNDDAAFAEDSRTQFVNYGVLALSYRHFYWANRKPVEIDAATFLKMKNAWQNWKSSGVKAGAPPVPVKELVVEIDSRSFNAKAQYVTRRRVRVGGDEWDDFVQSVREVCGTLANLKSGMWVAVKDVPNPRNPRYALPALEAVFPDAATCTAAWLDYRKQFTDAAAEAAASSTTVPAEIAQNAHALFVQFQEANDVGTWQTMMRDTPPYAEFYAALCAAESVPA